MKASLFVSSIIASSATAYKATTTASTLLYVSPLTTTNWESSAILTGRRVHAAAALLMAPIFPGR